MDITNLTYGVSKDPVAAKTASVVSAANTAKQGNTLPVAGQEIASSDKSQNSSNQLSSDELNQLVGQVNQSTLIQLSNLKFTVDEGTEKVVVRIEDRETGELIRQIPSEEMLAVAKALGESSQGTMFQETV